MSLFQRIVGSKLNDFSDKIKPIWIQYPAFENSMAVDGGILSIGEEKRFRDKSQTLMPARRSPTGLALQAYRYSF